MAFYLLDVDTRYFFDCTEYFVNEGTSTLDITVTREGDVSGAAAISEFYVVEGVTSVCFPHNVMVKCYFEYKFTILKLETKDCSGRNMQVIMIMLLQRY